MVDATNNTGNSVISRRAALGSTAAASAGAAAHTVLQKTTNTGRANDLVMMDAVSLASTIHSRETSCVEVMTAYLDHIEKLNVTVNAIVTLQDRMAVSR
jgi:amidase